MNRFPKRDKPVQVRNATWKRAARPLPCGKCHWWIDTGEFFLVGWVSGQRVCMTCARTLPILNTIQKAWPEPSGVRR